MTPADLLAEIEQADGEVWAEGDRLKFRAVPARLIPAIREHKTALLALLSIATPDAYAREERAAIREHDGGLPRAEAERLAGIVPLEPHPAPEGCRDVARPPAARPGASMGQETATICCRGCQHFTPDAVSAAEGLGRCSVTSNGLPPPGGRGYGCCLPHAPRSCPEFLGVAI